MDPAACQLPVVMDAQPHLDLGQYTPFWKLGCLPINDPGNARLLLGPSSDFALPARLLLIQVVVFTDLHYLVKK